MAKGGGQKSSSHYIRLTCRPSVTMAEVQGHVHQYILYVYLLQTHWMFIKSFSSCNKRNTATLKTKWEYEVTYKRVNTNTDAYKRIMYIMKWTAFKVTISLLLFERFHKYIKQLKRCILCSMLGRAFTRCFLNVCWGQTQNSPFLKSSYYYWCYQFIWNV